MSESPTPTSDFKRAVREAKNRPVKCRIPLKTSMAKPSTAPLGSPVPLRGHYATPSEISPIRQWQSHSGSGGYSGECTGRFEAALRWRDASVANNPKRLSRAQPPT